MKSIRYAMRCSAALSLLVAGCATTEQAQMVDTEGKAHERLYDVAVSEGRKIGKDGRCKTPVGNTVDVKKATWKNTIGEPDLIAVWKDPDFDPDEKAFYYARVIEIPTPRWTAYDLIRLDADMPKDVKMITQERVYTSPIWYTP